jgi:hypothetical protein
MGRGIFTGLVYACAAVFAALPAVAEMEFDASGYIEPELQLFFETPSDIRQHNDNLSVAGQLELELFLTSDQTLIVTPFARIDGRDDERTHFDLREAYYEAVFDRFELRVGLKKVFWGRTEAAHLIDVINQTDNLESVDGEEKLGQPMVNVTVPTEFGIFDFYWLPYFRERQFPGIEGRPRFDFPIANDMALYESRREEEHQDFAFRWSHYVGAWDFGLSHFYGTARDPLLMPGLDGNNQPVLIPYYAQMQQTSVDVQATYGPMLYKFEGFHRWQLGENWTQATGGIEYSFYGVGGTAGDLGIVAEYIWDERGETGMNPFQNDAFVGLRWAANDIQSTAILGGGIFDFDGNGYALSVEAERRFGENFFLQVETRLFIDVPPSDPFFSYADDDFLQIRLARYF